MNIRGKHLIHSTEYAFEFGTNKMRKASYGITTFSLSHKI